jgi:GNAT superfamily N-acetyltransferase
LVLTDSLAELEHMWIRPAHMGTGVGRALFNQIVERAVSLNARVVELSADPNAEGFYKHLGATRIGEVRSEIEGQPRLLPRMRFALSP